MVPLVESLIRAGGSTDSGLEGIENQHLGIELASTPDIFVVVADGYAGRIAFDYQYEIAAGWERILTGLEFQVPKSAWTPYPTTELAIPALLDMSYPAVPEADTWPASPRALHRMIGGDNRLVQELTRNGYRFVMVESGWSGSVCGVHVDECVASWFLDEATFLAVDRTILSQLVLETFGHSFTIGTRSSMRWLLDNSSRISANGTPDLVIAHLMAPHPPFFLDESCALHHDRSRWFAFARSDSDPDETRAAYLEQAACIDGFMARLAQEVGDDVVIVYVSDHGTAERRQLWRVTLVHGMNLIWWNG